MAKKLFKTVGKVAIGGLLGSQLFGKKKKKVAAAPEPTERVMPLPDDEAVKRARMASILQQRGRSGRSSTILTGGSGSTLGG